MKGKNLLLIAATMMLLILFSGCTSTDSSQIKNDTTVAATSVQEQSAAPEPFIVRVGNIPEDITITSNAKSVNENSSILIYYTLDSMKTDAYANQDGWKITVTAFAYNTGSVPADFSPASSEEVRNSGVPYLSRSIHVYPYNVYSDSIEISDSPSGQIIDANKPYNYGIIFTLQ